MDAKKAVIYQVEATLTKDVPVQDYLNWLNGHAEDIFKAAKGFVSAEAFTVESDDVDAPIVLVVSYRVESRENLQDYFDNHAARLRESGKATWGDKVSYTRKILHLKEEYKPVPQTSVFGYVH